MRRAPRRPPERARGAVCYHGHEFYDIRKVISCRAAAHFARWGSPRLIGYRLIALALSLAGSSAAAGANLLRVLDVRNCTADAQASTTVPGWTTIDGSPSLRCPTSAEATAPPATQNSRISSGPYGASALERTIGVGAGAAAIDRGLATYEFSGLFGAAGAGRERAILTMTFRDAAGRRLAGVMRRESPVAAPGAAGPVFAERRASGRLPRGTRSLRVVLRFVDVDGPMHAAYAERLSLTLQPDLEPQPAPKSALPRFDHVFMIMMENTSYEQVIGDSRDAPFINALAARGTLLARYSGVYHPSDQNYLAIAGGDAAVQGAVYFPNIRLHTRHLGDTIEAAGQTWRAYEQGMGTPCNTTTQYDKYFQPDDAPFINYSDVIGDAARCRKHLVDAKQLPVDLRSAATTPNFSWIAADYFDDGEDSGNGSPASLRAQDRWLRRTLRPVFASAAWRTRRCLLILTWDESDATRTNHVAAILVGSLGSVRAGFVSNTRYDHYSTALTIERALNLPSLTANDEYAAPIDDAFVN